MRTLHKEHDQTLGSPRMHRELVKQGLKVGRQRVAHLMRENQLWGRIKRRFQVTTDSTHTYPIADNLLGQDFRVQRPDQVWVGDLTYIGTKEGWLYVAVLIDLYARRVVGWQADTTLRHTLPLAALESAVALRRPKPGLIHHSDRGVQYACNAYRHCLDSHGLVASMSRKGNCWDNAVAESFFATLKVERVYRRTYETAALAARDVASYIDYYNRRRPHSYLDYESPIEFEQQRDAA